MIHRILVGVDGSDGSLRALRWATARAVALDAEVLAVCAIPHATEFLLTLPPLSTDLFGEYQESLEHQWSQPLRDAGVEHRLFLLEADPMHAIVDLANREGADMIVLGTQSHGTFSDLLFGSISYKVSHHASCPVVIVPATMKHASSGAV